MAERRPAHRALLAAVVVAVLVRVLAIFPLYRHPAEADVTLNGLCAMQVLEGHWPTFFSGYRLGSLECYATALSTLLAGPSRWALEWTALAFNLLELAFTLLFVRQLFGRTGLCWAIPFLLVPPLAVVFWTSVPNGYAALGALLAALLWAAARFVRTRAAPDFGLLGLLCGVSLWHSALSLPVVAAAGVWVAASVGRNLLRRQALVLGFLGFFLGSAPWWIFNARHGWPSLNRSFTTQTVDRRTAVETLKRLVDHRIPELFLSTDPQNGANPGAPFARTLARPTRWVVAASLLGVAALFWTHRRSAAHRRFALLVGTAGFAVVAVNTLSFAGSVPGMNERYVLPLAILVPSLAAWAGSTLRGRGRWLLAGVATLWVSFQCAAFYWPWGRDRQAWQSQALAFDRALAELSKEGVGTVIGNYWVTYPFAYLSGGRILPWTCEGAADYHALREPASLQASRAAFLHFIVQPPAWRADALATGARQAHWDPLLSGLIIDRNPFAATATPEDRAAVTACDRKPY